jgi:hypothetical protein
MKNFTLSFIFIVFTCQALFSQELEGRQVTLRAYTSVNGKEFFTKTICNKDSVRIKFKSKDSVSFNKLRNDRVYKKLMRSFGKIKHFDLKNDRFTKTC